ncbi:MAG: Asp-tRNA(Asn)/Glu-tRNA(Gln) amidotransferase subunit GatA [Pseudomonadota bacterium]|nr:Asp-tRNA(Asn)/Glu-tRNA(Gln) amidotransferase subunit GatA [Pseudomonadota bacterium]
MTALHHLTATDMATGLSNGDFSSIELTKAHIDAMTATKDLNAFITETPVAALKMAADSDARRAKGEAGPLDGLPIAVKDLFCTKGVRSTAASRILDNFVPPYESTVTSNLWRDGAVLLGKTNLDEFAMGSSNMFSACGPAISPWRRKDSDVDLVPGGSSGGSAVAVSSRAAPLALGTDTGGSVRQPASYTGLVGMKPTYGRCSRFGIIAYASSLDQAGAFTRSVADMALLMRSMAGHDSKDSTSVDCPVPDYPHLLAGGAKGLRIGIPKQYRSEHLSEQIKSIWDDAARRLEAEGARLVEIDLPHTRYALACYYIIAPAECSSNLARYDGVRFGVRVHESDLTDMYEQSRATGFGEEVKRRIMIGTYVLSSGYYDAYYIKAQRVRRLIADDFTRGFEKCDVLLAPAAPTTAFVVGENADDPIAMYLNDVCTVPSSLAGLPGITVPVALGADGCPYGLQILGRPFDEAGVLRAASALEAVSGFDATPARMA